MKIKWGSVYKIKDFVELKNSGLFNEYFKELNNQTYGMFLPCFDGENYWLVDTYEISGNRFECTENDLASLYETIVSFKDKDIGNIIAKGTYDYYYQNKVKLNDKVLSYFEPICNLNDMKCISRDHIKRLYQEIPEKVKELYPELPDEAEVEITVDKDDLNKDGSIYSGVLACIVNCVLLDKYGHGATAMGDFEILEGELNINNDE